MQWMTLSFCLMLIGVIAWRVGRRGKVVDDHWLCRKCRYDLTGLPEGSDRCPECGADLSVKRSRVKGNRRRQPLIAGVGAVAIVVGLWGTVQFGWGWWEHFDATPWKPAFVLRREYLEGPWPESNVARDELLTRVTEGRISDSAVDGLIDGFVKMWRDPDGKWPSKASELIEKLYRQKRVTQEQLHRLAEVNLREVVMARKQVTWGKQLPVIFGWQTRLHWIMENPQSTHTPGDLSAVSDVDIDGVVTTHQWPTKEEYAYFDLPRKPGLHDIHIKTRLRYKTLAGPVDREVSEVVQVEVLPEGKASATGISDAAMEAKVEASIATSMRFQIQGNQICNIRVPVRNSRVAFVWHGFLRQGSSVADLGHQVFHASGDISFENFSSAHFLPGKAELILEPDSEYAEEIIPVLTYWNKRITRTVTLE